jgi:hypothetical protein
MSCFNSPFGGLCLPIRITIRFVIPAQAGIHPHQRVAFSRWIPACAGMTELAIRRQSPFSDSPEDA